MSTFTYVKLINTLARAGLTVEKVVNNRANLNKQARFVLFEALKEDFFNTPAETASSIPPAPTVSVKIHPMPALPAPLPLTRRQMMVYGQITHEWAAPPKSALCATLLSLERRKMIEMRPNPQSTTGGLHNTDAWQYRKVPV